MNQHILLPSVLALSFLVLFALSEFLYHKFKIPAELTRKIVHVGTGIITLLFPVFLHSHWQVLFLCGSFLLLLLASLRFNMLPSINAVDRESYGSLLYPVSVYGCYLIYAYMQKGLILFYLPIVTLALADPVAALVGKQYPLGKYHIGKNIKTLSGSLAFFVVCLSICLVSFYLNEPINFSWELDVIWSVLIATIATLAEAVGLKGRDNFTIPASVALTLSLIL